MSTPASPGGEYIFKEEEKEHFRWEMERLLRFCGLEALAWCCMSNHFHILISTPNGPRAEKLREAIGDEELFGRMNVAFSEEYISRSALAGGAFSQARQ